MKANKINKKNKITLRDILQYICAVIFCTIPFIPFVDEMNLVWDVVGGDLVQVPKVQAHMVLTYTWYGYLPIIVAILVVIATITKKNWIRLVMMVADVAVAAYLVYLANRLVAKIYEAGLYEPTVGYYLELVASVLVLIITLLELMKENNKPVVNEKNK